MRSRQPPVGDASGRPRRSFIEETRRAQIVDATVQVISEVGYVHATLAKIARPPGSPRV
jgi:AcrR family transcriptional regulator